MNEKLPDSTHVVLVKHSKNSPKRYCFAVPSGLLPYIKTGVAVICDTAIGKSRGTVMSEVVSGPDVEAMLASSHATLPLREITNVIHSIDISGIKLPVYMELYSPPPSELSRRRMEFQNLGYFNTDVVVDDSGVLREGHSAYLVSKSLGLDAIPFSVS